MWLLVRVAAHDKKCYCSATPKMLPVSQIFQLHFSAGQCVMQDVSGSILTWALWLFSLLDTALRTASNLKRKFVTLAQRGIALIIHVNRQSPILISCYNYHRYLLYYGLVLFIYWLHLFLFQTSVSINRIGKFLHKDTRDPGVVSHHSKDSKEWPSSRNYVSF